MLLSVLTFGTTTVRAIGGVIAVIAALAIGVYLVLNILAGRKEVGSELELAPNRKQYHDDDRLEGKTLTRVLGTGMILLGISAVGLPLYWLAEPGRQEGAVEEFERIAVQRGLEQYEEGSQCVNCHSADGKGGQAPHTILDNDSNFVASVNWMAPALNTVLLRYTKEEVANIIDFGRPGTPMAAWGAGGGGPRSEQEIENIIEYIEDVQLTPEESQRQAAEQLVKELGLVGPDESDKQTLDDAIAQIDYNDLETGETLFNLGKEPAFAGGAYACARCHTAGWSIITEGEDAVQPSDADIEQYVDYLPGSGRLGPPLSNEVPRQFADIDTLADFVATGSEEGIGYGQSGQGSGRMPGFGDDPNTEEVEHDGMMTQQMVCAIARYEATLRGGDEPASSPPTTAPSTTTTTTGEDGEAEEGGGGEAQVPYCEAAEKAEGEGG